MFAVLIFIFASINAESHLTGPQSSRRLWWSGKLQHMWGACDPMDRASYGCSLSNPKCSDHLSPGPDNADIEIRLGGLPPSTAQEPVHLHWWAARKSPTKFQLLDSPVNVSVYSSIRDAYPKYSDDEFNGGNVRITESGEAVIKIQSPATYFVCNSIAIPHIHLRTCRGDSFSIRVTDAIMFGLNEQWVLSGSEDPVQIISATRLSPMIPSSVKQNVPSPVAVIIAVWKIEPGSTTFSEVTTSTFTTTGSLSSRDVQISVAKENYLDLDALEFSPIYQCFMENLFFDHFSADCTHTCPAHSVVEHGQCVRKMSSNAAMNFDATWKLEVKCGSRCWHDKKNVTLHRVRLSVAGHFDIPFQEVDEVTLGFNSVVDRRRLDDTNIAYLRISVETRRHTKESGDDLLANFFPEATVATELLGFAVHGVEYVANPVDTSNLPSMNKGNDPYTPAYEALEKSGPSVAMTGSPSEFLPAAAVIGIAAGVIVLGIILAIFALWRRRRANLKKAAEKAAAKGKEVDNEVVEEPKGDDGKNAAVNQI